MFNLRQILFGFVAFVLVSTCMAADKVVDKVTSAENLFAIQVNNFEYTLGQVDQYIAGVSPVPMGTRMLVRMQLAGALGNPELPGLDMNGSFTVFGVLLPGEGEAISRVFLGGLVPVTDYEKFISSNPSIGKADKNGVSTLSIIKPGPGGSANSEAAASGLKIFLAPLGGFALIGPSDQYDKLVQYRKLMASKISSTTSAAELASVSDSAQAQEISKEPICIYGNIQVISKSFGPLLFAKIEEMKTAMSNMGSGIESAIEKLEAAKKKLSESGTDKDKIAELEKQIQRLKEQQKQIGALGTQGVLAKIINIYSDILRTLMNESESVTVAVRPSSEVLRFSTTLTAVANSDMAELFTGGAAYQENDLLGYLEDGAVSNFVFRLERPFWKKLMVKGLDLFSVIRGESISAEKKAKLAKLAVDSIDSVGGPMTGTLSVDATKTPPFVIKYFAAIKDVAKFNRVMDESDAFFEDTGIKDFYKDLGIEIDWEMKRNSDSYKGVSIDSAQLKFKAIEPNQGIGEIIEAMYGEGFDYRWGIFDGFCVIAIGSDADSVVRELIDRVKSGKKKEIPSEVKAAMAYLPGSEKADFFATYNYIRLFKMLGAIMPNMSDPNSGMPAIDVPSTSNLCFSGTSGGGKMVFAAALPKQHLGELISAIMQFRLQMPKRPCDPE